MERKRKRGVLDSFKAIRGAVSDEFMLGLLMGCGKSAIMDGATIPQPDKPARKGRKPAAATA